MNRLLKNREILLVVIIAIMVAGFSTRAQGFASPGNLANIFNDTSILIILALGQMTVILTKSIDLSVAANLAFTGMAVAMTNAAYPGTVIFENNGKAGMLDLQGKEIGKPVYESLVYSYDDSLVRAKQDGKTGVLSPAGMLSVPAKYAQINMFTAGQAVVSLNAKFGVTDKSGREIIPLQYDAITTTDAIGREIRNYAEKVVLNDTFRAYIVKKQGRYGLLAWNEADFLRLMRTGQRPDGRQLHRMMPWKSYSAMQDVELRAVWTYLRSLPPVEGRTRS